MTGDTLALPGSALDGFLFADVGREANGMTLSVLSAFARREMDPWQEAAYLATLPAAAAIDRLARVIAAMPASPWSLQDATGIAERLVPLLPVRDDGASTAAPAPADRGWPLLWLGVAMALVAAFTTLAPNLLGH
jgi:hypothetical protein